MSRKYKDTDYDSPSDRGPDPTKGQQLLIPIFEDQTRIALQQEGERLLSEFDADPDQEPRIDRTAKLLSRAVEASTRAMLKNGTATPEQIDRSSSALLRLQRIKEKEELKQFEDEYRIARLRALRAQATIAEEEAKRRTGNTDDQDDLTAGYKGSDTVGISENISNEAIDLDGGSVL